MCLFLAARGIKPVYVTVNRLLQQQAELKLKEFAITTVPVVLMDDLRKHFGQKKVFIFDEYYHAIINAKVKFMDRQLPPIFDLGFKE
jgi:hypothetical protein